MKGIIYYFSGTGNNYMLAKDLAALLPSTEIRPMRFLPEDKERLPLYDIVGFCAPSYYSHVPAAVKTYLEGARFAREQIIFTVIGCGSSRGRSTEELRERIEAAGGVVKNEYLVVSPGNFILSYGAFPKIYERTVLRSSKRKTIRIAREVIDKENSRHLKKAPLFFESQEPAVQKILETFPRRATEYSVSDRCVGCGICAGVCPVGNIRIADNRPVFDTNCQQCMACIQWCPNRAIDYRNIAASRKRYRHPDLSVQELIGKQKNKTDL